MSTKFTLEYYDSADPKLPSWHLYHEAGESDVVYLELDGATVDLRARGRDSVVLRLPVETARQLGIYSTTAKFSVDHPDTTSASDAPNTTLMPEERSISSSETVYLQKSRENTEHLAKSVAQLHPGERREFRKSSLYETDFYLWTHEQVAILRSGKLSELDVQNLLEEVADLGYEQRLALKFLLRQILVHLIMLDHSTSDRLKVIGEICSLRAQAAHRIENTPTLNALAPDFYRTVWPIAKRQILALARRRGETVSIPLEACPYTLEQVLDFEFFPPVSAL